MMTFEEFADAKKHPFSNLKVKWLALIGELLNSNLLNDLRTQTAVDDGKGRRNPIATSRISWRLWGAIPVMMLHRNCNRCKLDIARAKRKARNILKRAIQENPELSPDNVEKLDVVQAAFAERDRIIAELKPIVAELEKKLMDAEEILKKYG